MSKPNKRPHVLPAKLVSRIAAAREPMKLTLTQRLAVVTAFREKTVAEEQLQAVLAEIGIPSGRAFNLAADGTITFQDEMVPASPAPNGQRSPESDSDIAAILAEMKE